MSIDLEVLKDNYYINVFQKDWKPYADFRLKHELKHFKEGEMTLDYYDIGEGPVLLCLPGSTGKALTFYPYFETLSEHYRIIAIDYPIADGVTSLGLKVMNFIRQMDFESVYIFSNSFGTIIAQFLLSRMGENIKGVVFAHGATKTKTLASKAVRYHQKGLKSFITSIRFLNFTRFQRKFASQLRKNTSICPDDESKRLFWEGMYLEMLYTTSKEEMVSNYGFMLDFWKNYVFDASEFNVKHTPMIIIDSQADHEKNLPEKQALRGLFQSADFEVIKGDSQMSLIKNSGKISEIVLRLLDVASVQ